MEQRQLLNPPSDGISQLTFSKTSDLLLVSSWDKVFISHASPCSIILRFPCTICFCRLFVCTILLSMYLIILIHMKLLSYVAVLLVTIILWVVVWTEKSNSIYSIHWVFMIPQISYDFNVNKAQSLGKHEAAVSCLRYVDNKSILWETIENYDSRSCTFW